MEPGEVRGSVIAPLRQPAMGSPGIHQCLQPQEQPLPATEEPMGLPLLTASCTRTSPEGGDQPFSKTLQKAPKSPSSSKQTFCHDENGGHVYCPTGSVLTHPGRALPATPEVWLRDDGPNHSHAN